MITIAHYSGTIVIMIGTAAAIIAMIPLVLVISDLVAGLANLAALMKSSIVVLGFIVMVRLVKNQLKSNEVGLSIPIAS